MANTITGAWFAETDPDKLAATIWEYVQYLQDTDKDRLWKERVHSALYETDFTLHPYSKATSYLGSVGIQPVSLNVCRSVVDTVMAKVAKNQPALKIGIDGADWTKRLQAKDISKWLNVKTEASGFRKIAPLLLRDAEKHGTGIVKVSHSQGRVVAERIPYYEVFVDPIESFYGKPRSFFQVKMVAREVLLEMFPDSANAISSAPQANQDDLVEHFHLNTNFTETKHDMVKVIEAWHLPSGPSAEDGVHAITLRGSLLQRCEWTRDSSPFEFVYWNSPDQGIWGTGLIQELASIQWEIDQCIRIIQDTLDVGARLKIFLSRSSKIVKTHLNNKVGAFVEFTGQPPMFHAPNPVSQQLFDWLKMLYQWAYEISGVSQLSAQAKLPPRMGDSSLAMQTFYDIETERFSPVAIGYANLHVSAGHLHLAAAKDLAKLEPADREQYADHDLDDKIDWDDLDLRRDKFTLQLEAVNFLPDTRAGKLATIKELSQANLPAPLLQQLLGQHLENPDMQGLFAVVNAANNNASWIVDQLENPKLPMPEPELLQDFDVAIPLVKAAFQDAQANNAPEEVLTRFRDWNTMAVNYLESLAPPPEVPPGPPANGPMGPGPGAEAPPLPPGPPLPVAA